jgi:hypothetical protein
MKLQEIEQEFRIYYPVTEEKGKGQLIKYYGIYKPQQANHRENGNDQHIC